MEIVSPNDSSTSAPKITLASGATNLYIIFAALLTSLSVNLDPPLILNTTPLALSIVASSKGLEMAAIAASSAAFSPEPIPIPINAVPALLIMVRTSAKSTLMSPGCNIMSVIPITPWRNISSATQKARSNGVSSGIISSSRSLDTTIIVSTCLRSSSMAFRACVIRRFPSKANGLVTIPMVKHPISLAIRATTGAAPEPVPPPIPAVMKHKSHGSII